MLRNISKLPERKNSHNITLDESRFYYEEEEKEKEKNKQIAYNFFGSLYLHSSYTDQSKFHDERLRK